MLLLLLLLLLILLLDCSTDPVVVSSPDFFSSSEVRPFSLGGDVAFATSGTILLMDVSPSASVSPLLFERR